MVTLADSGHLDLRKERILLETEVRRVLDFFGPSLDDAGFSPLFKPVDITITADGTRIRQALLALLENARATPSPVGSRSLP